jgi:hypothetical protein
VPQSWAPFLADPALADWRDFIGSQLPPGGSSQTLQVLGERLDMPPQLLAQTLADEATMQAELWAHVPKHLLSQVETQMYDHALDQLAIFYAESDLERRT